MISASPEPVRFGLKARTDTNLREGKMPLRQAQGKLSRQPAGPFDSAQGRLPALQSDCEAPKSPNRASSFLIISFHRVLGLLTAR